MPEEQVPALPASNCGTGVLRQHQLREDRIAAARNRDTGFDPDRQVQRDMKRVHGDGTPRGEGNTSRADRP